MNAEQIAAVVHNVNREIQRIEAEGGLVAGANIDPTWDELAATGDWRRDSSIRAVQELIDNPDTSFEQQHQSWFAERVAQGWTWGPVKDPVAKTNPAMVPYEKLPATQRLKDYTRKAITLSLKD